MTDDQIINEHLAKFGKNDFGQPLYRIVWSDYQLEHRKGVFREFIGKLFLREFVGVKEVPKYSYIIERWILERWFPGSMTYTPEIPETISGSYEPIYVFQDRFGNFLPLNLKVAELIVVRAEYRKDHPTETESEEDLEKKEIEHYMDSLEISPIANALHMKEAVGYTKEIKNG